MCRLSLLFLLLILCTAVPAQRNGNGTRRTQPTTQRSLLERQRNLLRERQKQARQRQQELEKQVAQRIKDVEMLASDIDDIQIVLDSLHIVIDSVNTNIAVLDSQFTILQQELEERRQHYIRSLRYMYRNRNAQTQLIFVLSAKNFDQMYRRMRFMREYTTHQRAQGEAVKQKSEQVAVKLDELNTARSELNVLLAKNEDEQHKMEEKKEEQQRIVADLQQEQKTVDKLIAQQKREEGELTSQINKLVAEELERQRRADEERRRRREEAQAAAANNNTATTNRNTRRRNTTPATPTTPSYRDADPDRQLTGSFRSNKGRLPVPITGSYRVVRPYGKYSIGGVTLNSSGVHLEGQAGAQARCVFNGEVSRVYNAGQSGYVVMVRHGRYISVYSNLSSVTVTAGQHVTTNQALGAVGPTHVLLFRLQDWDKILNPKQWLSRL